MRPPPHKTPKTLMDDTLYFRHLGYFGVEVELFMVQDSTHLLLNVLFDKLILKMGNLIQNIWREKVKEAIVYFSREVRHPSKTMIFKLLAELDFRHYRETGEFVTNFDYYTWPWGPVPRDFFYEITEKDDVKVPPDFRDALYIRKSKNETGTIEFDWVAKRPPRMKRFSPRQKGILKQVVDIYRTALPSEATKASHEVETPWKITMKTKGEKQLIEPVEVVDAPRELKEKGQEKKNTMNEFIANYGLQSQAGG
jgi:hypothetical protein